MQFRWNTTECLHLHIAPLAATQHFGRFRSEANIDWVRVLPDAPPGLKQRVRLAGVVLITADTTRWSAPSRRKESGGEEKPVLCALWQRGQSVAWGAIPSARPSVSTCANVSSTACHAADAREGRNSKPRDYSGSLPLEAALRNCHRILRQSSRGAMPWS